MNEYRVQPIGLAAPTLNVNEFDKPNATVAGWGVTRESGRQSRILRAVNVPVVGKMLLFSPQCADKKSNKSLEDRDVTFLG